MRMSRQERQHWSTVCTDKACLTSSTCVELKLQHHLRSHLKHPVWPIDYTSLNRTLEPHLVFTGQYFALAFDHVLKEVFASPDTVGRSVEIRSQRLASYRNRAVPQSFKK